MEEAEYSDDEEYQDNYLDEQRDLWEQQYGNYPIAKKPESLFGLFKEVWRTNDSTKVGNLNDRELGDIIYSVRDAKRIALLASYLKHPYFSEWFLKNAEIVLSTSMSKKGWFPELFVSTKKFAHKASSPNPQWKMFEKKTEQPLQQED